jgi:hypothetical protein
VEKRPNKAPTVQHSLLAGNQVRNTPCRAYSAVTIAATLAAAAAAATALSALSALSALAAADGDASMFHHLHWKMDESGISTRGIQLSVRSRGDYNSRPSQALVRNSMQDIHQQLGRLPDEKFGTFRLFV